MKVLEKAKLSESLVTEEICTRIIKSFKDWYKSAVGKEFEEIKKIDTYLCYIPVEAIHFVMSLGITL